MLMSNYLSSMIYSIKILKVYRVIFFILIFTQVSTFAQSYNADNATFVNFVKRMYTTSPFTGAKLVSGEEGSFYIAAINLPNNSNEQASKKAHDAAKITFAEPCVKMEMLSTLPNEFNKSTTYLFSFQPLSTFIKDAYNKQAFTGAKIISAPLVNYFVSVISLDSQKYTSVSMMDRVALIKAKQQANTLFNGSTISSDMIIKTDEHANIVSSTEIIREQSMGFVEGLELLSKFSDNQNKVYIFYRELIKK